MLLLDLLPLAYAEDEKSATEDDPVLGNLKKEFLLCPKYTLHSFLEISSVML